MINCSIIIPVYNCEEKYLRQCLDSAAGLLGSAEVIVVDDGSDEETGAILQEYASNYKEIRLIRQENQGVSSARNHGLEKASGKWIFFADADDLIESENLIKLLESKDADGDADLIYAPFYKNNGDKQQCEMLESMTDAGEYLHNMLCHPNLYGAVWGKLFRRDLIEKNGIGFDPELSHAEDTEFIVRYLTKASNVLYYSEPLYHYYIFPSSAAKINRNALASFSESIGRIGEAVKDRPEYDDDFANCCNINLLIMMVNYVFREGIPYREGKKAMKELLDNELFRKSLKRYNKEEMGLANRVVLAALRCRATGLGYLATVIRRKQ